MSISKGKNYKYTLVFFVIAFAFVIGGMNLFPVPASAATITGGNCDVLVVSSGESNLPWTYSAVCKDNLNKEYILEFDKATISADIPSGPLNDACGISNWTWQTTFSTPGTLNGTFTCINPVNFNPAYIDIGLRVAQYLTSNPSDGIEVVPIAIINPAGNAIYGSCGPVYHEDIGEWGGTIGTYYIDCDLTAVYADQQAPTDAIANQRFTTYANDKCSSYGGYQVTVPYTRTGGGSFVCNNQGAPQETSPLYIAKNGSAYRVALVHPTNQDATKIIIRLANGDLMALRRF